MTAGLIGFVAMFALMMLRVPIAVSMGAVGLVGLGVLRSWPAALSSAAGEFIDIGSYTLSVVPLFVLMGNFVTRAGMSRDLYQAAYAFVGHRRGGLGLSTIAACAGFGAICGSSIATTATMARRGHAGNAALQLRPRIRGRIDLRRRHARHPDSALGHSRDLRDHDRAEHRRPVRGRRDSRSGPPPVSTWVHRCT